MIFDLIVVGGGPGGYVAAIRAAQLDLSVALIEKSESLGGTCLHRGCIPSKAYLAAAEMVEIARKAEKVGIHFGNPKIDFARLVMSKDEKVKKLSQGISELVKANKITLLRGEGTLEGIGKVKVENQTHAGRFILLATGSQPVKPSLFPFDGQSVLTTDELFLMTQLPQRLLIVGGGVSGCEMACAFNLLGVQVTLVELQPTILPNEEKMAVRGLRSVLEKRGVIFKTGISVTGVKQESNAVTVTLSEGDPLVVDKVLVAIGRKVDSKALGLDSLGIQMEKGYVKTNLSMETSVEGIYAVGDLVGTTLLAHGAMAEGECAVENIAGTPTEMDYASVPRVVYTLPEIASVGLREEEIKNKQIPYKAGRFSYRASGKALCHEDEEGFAQILVGTEGDKKDKILGATILGAHAADLIQEVTLVCRHHLPVQSLMETIHAHPSLGEVVHEAALDTQGRAIHKVGHGK